MNNDFAELLRTEAEEISLSFKKASIEGKDTPQEVSDRREECFKSFLEKYFPFPYRIVKGNVIDSEGRRSDSIDCLVLNPSHPYTINLGNNKASIIFADGVDYAIELKPELTSKNEVHRALKQIRSIKQLVRCRCGCLGQELDNPEKYAHAHRIPGIIFSEKTFKDTNLLLKHIVDYYEGEKVPLVEQFDLLVVNNSKLIYNFRPNSYMSHGFINGLAYEESKENTLIKFLMHINRMPHSEMTIGPNILSFYLNFADQVLINPPHELNDRLRSIRV